MTVNTFIDRAQLKAEVLAYAARKDDKIVSRLDTFIKRAESRLDSVLRIPTMERVNSFIVKSGDQGYTLPADYLDVKHLAYFDTGVVLYRQSFENMSPNQRQTGEPTQFARGGNRHYFDAAPTADTKFVITYYAKPPVMQTDSDRNIYLDQAPYALLYSVLTDINRLIGGEEAEYYSNLFNNEVSELNVRAEESEWGGSTAVNAWNDDYELYKYF